MPAAEPEVVDSVESASETASEPEAETGLWERMQEKTPPPPVPDEEDEDLLDIPAFLRRQAN